MPIRPFVEDLYTKQVDELSALPEFRALVSGKAGKAEYDRFLVNVIRTHLLSPHYVAFLFGLAAPRSAESYKHNLLEELGCDDDEGVPHPALLEQLACGADLGNELPRLRDLAQETRRQSMTEALLFGTMRDVGLAAMCEISAFEFMLSRLASTVARALKRHRGLDDNTLEWFTHHSEVDIEHAEQTLQAIEDYVFYYGLTDEEAKTICEMSLRQNVFIKRYFGEISEARDKGLLC